MSWRSLRGFVPIAVLLGLWQLVGNPNSPTTPTPSTWWPALKSIERSGSLWSALEKTMLLYIEGLVLALILGVILGAALGASRRLTHALGPLLEFLRATPAAAFVPAAILLFHANTRTGIAIVVYGSVWPILLNIAAARAALPPLRLDVAHALGLSWWERMHKIVLPSLLPDLIVGLRVAAPLCLIITLLVDFLLATGGIGYLLVQYEQSFQASSAFAMLAVIGLIGVLINLVLGSATRVMLRRWPAGAESQ